MTAVALKRDSDEWRAARRDKITSTDLPIILGLSPYRAEADLAAEKLGGSLEVIDPKRRELMDLGKDLEDVIRRADQRKHGIPLRAVRRFITHPHIEWAATSLDFERVGERGIVEAKASRSRRWEDGVPQDVEVQVRWQMGVAGYPRAHIALLRMGSSLECWDVEHNPVLFDGLIEIAADFRARLAAGGPFVHSNESVKRRYPSDNGTEMAADADVEAAVDALVTVRERRRALEADEEHLEAAIKSRMADAAVLIGDGWRVTWKRTKDRTETDWESLSRGLLSQMPETERVALVGMHSAVREGFRPFRVQKLAKEPE